MKPDFEKIISRLKRDNKPKVFSYDEALDLMKAAIYEDKVQSPCCGEGGK